MAKQTPEQKAAKIDRSTAKSVLRTVTRHATSQAERDKYDKMARDAGLKKK